jgi:hypothetical protein
VYLCLGKVGDAADVVAVEVRDDDVPYVVGAKAKSLNLIDSGLGRVEYWPDQVSRRSDPSAGSSQSIVPNPESINTRPLDVSTSRTWHTISPHPSGYRVPQLRW